MTVRKPLVLGAAGLQQQLQSGDLLQLLASVAGSAALNIPQGAVPTTPVNGDIWTTAAGIFVRIAGVTVGPLAAGGGGGGGATYTPPLSVNFPWINQAAGATKTDITGALQMFGPAQGGARNYSFAGITAPATPWTRWMRLTVDNNQPVNYREMGILLADGTNKNIEWGNNYTNGFILEKVHNPSFAAAGASPAVTAVSNHPPLIGVTDDGTNLLFLISYDGVSSVQLYSESRTAFLAAGPTKVGFFINGYSTYDVTMNIAHFGANLPGPI